ncbi:MAG: aldose epimerase family protein [Ferruginibacter sp.]
MSRVITEKPFGNFETNAVTEYTISNANGMQVSVINYGATITKIITADKDGNSGNSILGFDSLSGYIENGSQYIGSIAGRYCNRIAKAAFSLDGKKYSLAKNNKENCLHGGNKGFDKVCWNVEKQEGQCLKLTYLSKDGEEGFPGNLLVEVTYTVSDDNELKIDYKATTDKACPVNLTSHCYFNLSAGKVKTILDHELRIFAELYTTLNDDAIPTGELASVINDRLDFRTAKPVGRDINDFPGGYDINFVLSGPSGEAATLYDPSSGRYMEMFTTEPGLQFYSGNFLHAARTGSDDEAGYVQHAALCLEAQHYPDSPNKPSFPNTILRPGETYRQTTVYKFSVK